MFKNFHNYGYYIFLHIKFTLIEIIIKVFTYVIKHRYKLYRKSFIFYPLNRHRAEIFN